MSALAKILGDPDDDGARGVYADELVERGDPRGEFIQVQLRLANLDPEDDEHPRLLARSDHMLAEHGAAWFGGPAHERLRVRRGFVEAIDPVPTGARERFEELAAREPITEVELEELPAPSPVTRRLRELRLEEPIVAGLLRALPAACPDLRRLGGWLQVNDEAFALLGRLGLEALDATALEDPRIARLWELPLRGLRLICSAPLALPGTFGGRRLDLTSGDLATLLDGVELDQLVTAGNQLPALFAWLGLERLPRLALHGMWPTRVPLLAGRPLAALRDLELAHGLKAIGGAELAAIAGAPWAARLRILRLHMDVEDHDALVALAGKMPRLTTLQGPFTAELVQRIRAAAGPRLVRVGEAHRRYELDWSETSR